MKKIILFILVLLLLLPITVNAQNDSDFRNLNWGMNRQEIIEVEGKPIDEFDDALVYQVTIGGTDYTLYLNLIENELVRAIYGNSNDYIDKNAYYDDFTSINNSLEDLYGKPDTSNDNWRDDNLKGIYSKETAFQLGQIDFLRIWNLEKTKIVHSLNMKNFEATHYFAYTSTLNKHQNLIEEESKEKTSNQL